MPHFPQKYMLMTQKTTYKTFLRDIILMSPKESNYLNFLLINFNLKINKVCFRCIVICEITLNGHDLGNANDIKLVAVILSIHYYGLLLKQCFLGHIHTHFSHWLIGPLPENITF